MSNQAKFEKRVHIVIKLGVRCSKSAGRLAYFLSKMNKFNTTIYLHLTTTCTLMNVPLTEEFLPFEQEAGQLQLVHPMMYVLKVVEKP